MMRAERNYIDLATLVAVMTLMVLSLGVVYSASSSWALLKAGSSEKLLGSHAIKVLVGCVMIFVFMHVDYHKYRKLTKTGLGLAVVLLLVTFALGGEVKGSVRWLRLWGLGFQPSEFAKYALLFHLCVLLAEKKEGIRDFRNGYLPMIVWIGAVTALVLIQPNFSTGAMIVLLSVIMLVLGRARFSHLAATLAAFVPLLLLYMLSAEYRLRRVVSFFTPATEGSSASNYQLWQGIIGFGNGGLFGLGPGQSRQRDLFLPESYGDFVFSVVGEEYGLVGTLFFLALFLVIMLRGMRIARSARDDLGRLLAAGITSTITVYALVNAGVTLGMLPTTGLPMPFVSYGGSSILFSSIAVGVLLNISSQTDMHPRLPAGAGRVRPVEPKPAAGSIY